MKSRNQPNSLFHENSPYLLQHAHNPVDWLPWSEETLARAQREDKPLLISIGYAACHWCHVMAHETFEDEAAAKVMNDNFICIKVDREERPDIDQIYMDAVQMMTGSGGWPLNCFALPDGSPFHGGTYFPRERWIALCKSVANEFKNNRKKILDYARHLNKEISEPYPFLSHKNELTAIPNEISGMVNRWKSNFDTKFGGGNHAPKFPMPVNLEFLLAYGYLQKDEESKNHVLLTLRRMAEGGIYDHLGGGFARYSTDLGWKVPHFEKMLYDNAQLISLYSHAFQMTKESLFRQVVEETAGFVSRELLSPEGLYYSSLDADSDGVEGKYYTWKITELKAVLGDLFPIAKEVFNINPIGLWEDDRYILLRQGELDSVALQLDLTSQELNERISDIKRILFLEREKRTRPALDNKSLTSWNGLMIKALAEANSVFNEEDYLLRAEEAGNFILVNLRMEDGGLYHSFREGKANIPGFLEDYTFFIEALIALYQATFDEKWLTTAEFFINFCIDHFLDKSSGFFFFALNHHKDNAIRKVDIIDGVIPSSNSSLAQSLFVLSRVYENQEWEEISMNMLGKMKYQIISNGSAFANWANLFLHLAHPFYEVAITGNETLAFLRGMKEYYLPNVVFAGTESNSDLSILQNRESKNETRIFICRDKVCRQPINDIDEAINQLTTE
ncbi:MAG TPA: thioredoxin domain-containing protein [Pelolinea sp.]|nr:thioredoxin domain-containing protein [Pelolinea sp.]